MTSIRILSDDLASQIAAGEVVERPSSALKELLENSVDAGATRVDVAIEGGGITLLSVLDDGVGMTEEDARLSLQRHATSKLRAFSDLEKLESYGFRGEALPSIASVSRLTLRTRRADEAAGVELCTEGGLTPTVQPTGCAPGTLVLVRDLFFNVPARRKFLRSTGTESGHITETVESLALANPQLSVTLTRDGRLSRRWLRVAERGERARSLIDEALASCQGERGPLKVEAFLSRPERARSGAAGLKLLINGRPIRDRALAVAVAQAYGSVLERGRYPRGVVYLQLPPELVDFNVHPQKLEVRFTEPRAVSDALYHILSTQLASSFSLPTPSRYPRPLGPSAASPSKPETTRVGESPRAAWASARRTPVYPPSAPPTASGGAPAAASSPASDTPLPLIDPEPTMGPQPTAAAHGGDVLWSSLRFVAQVRQTYLICEGDTGLYVVDQHAAAERVTYDRIRRQYHARAVASQSLLFPVDVELSPEEAESAERHLEDFASMGLELRPRSRTWLSVHSVPRLLEKASPERLVRDLLSETLREGGRPFSAAVDLALATMACHASLRAGESLSADAAKALLVALDAADFAGHCPHGRPIVSHTPWSELERKVGRR